MSVTWSILLHSRSDDATRLLEDEQHLAGVSAARLQLKDQVKRAEQERKRLKMKYDSLLEEYTLREKNVRRQSLKQAVARRSVYQDLSHNCSPRYHTCTNPLPVPSELQKRTRRSSRPAFSARSTRSGETVIIVLQVRDGDTRPVSDEALKDKLRTGIMCRRSIYT